MPGDSTKFYRCGSGVLSIYSCPSGTVFDSTLKTCNFASSIVTYAPSTACTSSVDLTVVPGDNTKFYRCGSGVLSINSCPSGTVFDSALKICNFASQIVTYAPSTVTATATATSAPQSCTIAQDRTPVDCTRYYVCTSGVLSISTCAAGLVFDSINQVCNIPSAVYGSCGTATATCKY